MYDQPSERMQEETISVAKHNKISEPVFAYLDALLRYKPHIKTLSAESYIMFAMKWIQSKDEEEKKQVLDESYKMCRKPVENSQRESKKLLEESLQFFRKK